MKKRQVLVLIAGILIGLTVYLLSMHYIKTRIVPSESPKTSYLPPSMISIKETEVPTGILWRNLTPPSIDEINSAYTEMMLALQEIPPPLPEVLATKFFDWRQRLEPSGDEKLENARCSLLARLDYLQNRAENGFIDDTDSTFFLSLLDEYESGEDPFADIRGTFLRGYMSPVDETIQPYSIDIPVAYDPARKWPLVISLHHHGWTDWFRPFQGHPSSSIDGAIVLSPHARGSADYMWVAFEEVLASLDDVKRNYAIDEDRVYITGYSMGGTGSWYVSSRAPHYFAAICPVAGNADFTAWVKRWDWRLKQDTPYAFLRQYLRESTCSAAYAENLRDVAVLCFHGSKDNIVPVEHARGMVDRLKQLGYPKVTYIESDAGHMGKSLDEIAGWLLTNKRNEFPRTVSLKTTNLRNNRSYYVRIFEREEMDRYCTVELTWGDTIEIKTGNVNSFGLDLSDRLFNAMGLSQEIPVTIDGVAAGKIEFEKNTGIAMFQRNNTAWSLTILPTYEPPYSKGSKRPGLEGPIEDAFVRPFLVVYGTGPADVELSLASRIEAERFVQNWKTRYVKPCAIKPDSEVTESDIEKYNLVLYGSPWTNSIMQRISPDLPFKITKDGISAKYANGTVNYTTKGAGVRFVQPNPFNNNRYVVVNASPTAEGLEGIDFRFGNWFDWIPYDNRAWYDFCVFDSRSRSPETFLVSGFFNNDWAFDTRWTWPGTEADRLAAVPRWFPPSNLPPHQKSVRLDEFRPAFTSTLKGFYNLNRSWDSGPLTAYGLKFEHGIGTRISSELIWYIGGNFRKFTATAGIDYGGKSMADITAARKDAEIVSLIVIGDGRILKKVSYLDDGMEPVKFDVDVTGVQYLGLISRRQTPEGWLYGSVTWGDATISE